MRISGDSERFKFDILPVGDGRYDVSLSSSEPVAGGLMWRKCTTRRMPLMDAALWMVSALQILNEDVLKHDGEEHGQRDAGHTNDFLNTREKEAWLVFSAWSKALKTLDKSGDKVVLLKRAFQHQPHTRRISHEEVL